MIKLKLYKIWIAIKTFILFLFKIDSDNWHEIIIKLKNGKFIVKKNNSYKNRELNVLKIEDIVDENIHKILYIIISDRKFYYIYNDEDLSKDIQLFPPKSEIYKLKNNNTNFMLFSSDNIWNFNEKKLKIYMDFMGFKKYEKLSEFF